MRQTSRPFDLGYPERTRSAALALLLLGMSACASLQSVSITEVPKQRERVVQADEDNIAFLGIHFSNDFADGLRDRLRDQCPRGRVTGIYTKYETYWYVLFQRRQVVATGHCVEDSEAGGPAAAHTAAVPSKLEHTTATRGAAPGGRL